MSFAGLVRSLLWLCVLQAFFVCDAFAATLRWEILPDRERATVTLNKEEGFAGQVRRVDRHGLLLDLGVPPLGMKEESPPDNSRIFYKGVPRGRAFAFLTKTPAFGFVVTRPDRNTVVIDVFSDPLGARWKPDDTDAGQRGPAATRSADAATAQNPPPATPENARAQPAGQTNAPADTPVDAQAQSAPLAGAAIRPTSVAPPARTAQETGAAVLSQPAAQPAAQPAVQAPSAPQAPPPAPSAVPSASRPAPPSDAAGAASPAGRGVSAAQGTGPSGAGTRGVSLRNLMQADAPKRQPPMPVLPMPKTVPPVQAATGPNATAAVSPAPPAAHSPSVRQPAQLAPAGQTNATQRAAQPSAARDNATILPEQQPDRGPSVRQPTQPAPAGQVAPVARVRPAVAGPSYFFRAKLNPGGPTDWKDMQAEGVAPAIPAAAPANGAAGSDSPATIPASATRQRISNMTGAASQAAPGGAAARTAANATEKVVYVDSQGKPVEPPADPVQAIADVRRDIAAGRFKDALEKTGKLMTHPELNREQTEEVRHLNAEMLFTVNKDDLPAHYDEIMSATISAMNYNQQSPRNAGAYLRLGYLNLKTGNIAEAEAYFNMLRRQYPLDEHVPLTYYYWGEYFYGRNEMQKAADQFQYVIQHFSESDYVRESALGLARSYMALGYYPQAMKVVEYIDSRWPRFYLDYPPVLEMMGDAGFRQGNLDYALTKYWTYYNLMPDGPNADIVLTRIGDVYARRKQMPAAKEIYQEAERRFPKKDGGLVAMMRLAEAGINDKPLIEDMFALFKGPFTLRPAEVYTRIIKEFPNSQLVPLAQLKLSMWYLWNKRYEDALQLCSDLVQRFPKHELAPRAEEVALKTFAILAAESISQNRPAQVAALWDKFPIIRKQQESLDPASRLALATGMWKDGDSGAALNMVEPFFLGAKIPGHSEQALRLALTVNLEHEQWKEIEKLAERVELWELTGDASRELQYALALAKENLNKSAEAAPIWKKLAESGKLKAAEQAYAEYFLARDAEAKNDLQDAYLMGRSSLNRFLTQAQNSPAQADTGKIVDLVASLMDISEKAGRLDEALDYARQYRTYLKPDDSRNQGLLFRMARIYQKQGNTPEWRKSLTELAEKYPSSVYGRTAASTLRSAKLAEDAAKFAPGGQL